MMKDYTYIICRKIVIDSLLSLKLEELSSATWERIRDGHILNIRQGEETLTDNILLEICRANLRNIHIIKTKKDFESETGTDWEWWIGSNNFGWIRYAIQAKKLDVTSQTYKSLSHTVRNTKKRQIDVLKKYAQANNAVPLYCFYNYSSDVNSSQWHCPLPFEEKQLGCTVTPAFVVNKALSKRGSRSFKKLHSAPETIPWRCLVKCPKILSIYKGDIKASKEKFGSNVHIFSKLPPQFSQVYETNIIQEYPPEFYNNNIQLYPKRILVIDIGDQEVK